MKQRWAFSVTNMKRITSIAILAACVSASAQQTTPLGRLPLGSNASQVTLYVDQRTGIDPSTTYTAPMMWGARGDIGRPFATIKAATRASLDGDQIVIAPGNYSADTAGSFAALRVYTAPGGNVYDSDASVAYNLTSTLATDTAAVLSAVDPYQISLLRDTSSNYVGASAVSILSVLQPSTLGQAWEGTGSWAASTPYLQTIASGSLATPYPFALTTAASTTAAIYNSVAAPAAGNFTSITAIRNVGAITTGNGVTISGAYDTTNGYLGNYWSSSTVITFADHSANTAAAPAITAANWNVVSASLASGDLTAYSNGVAGTSNASAVVIASGGTINYLICGANWPGGKTTSIGNQIGFFALLNVASKTGNNALLRNRWESLAALRVGAY